MCLSPIKGLQSENPIHCFNKKWTKICNHFGYYINKLLYVPILSFKCVNTVKINFGKTRLHDSNISTQGRVLNRPLENFYFQKSTANTTL